MWRKALEDLHDAGLTDQAIADLVTDMGYKTYQSLVFRYRTGGIKSASYEFAVIVIEIHKRLCKKRAKDRRSKPSAGRSLTGAKSKVGGRKMAGSRSVAK